MPEVSEIATISKPLFEVLPVADNEATIDYVEPHEFNKRIVTRGKIESLEKSIKNEIDKGQMDEVDCDNENLTHRFIDGVYARELFIPAGSVVIGKLHKYPRICIISGGECSFVTEYGSKRVKAPYTAIMPPGTKTAVYAHTDTTWTAIHGTEERDLDCLEDTFIAENHDSYEQFLLDEFGGERTPEYLEGTLCLGAQ